MLPQGISQKFHASGTEIHFQKTAPTLYRLPTLPVIEKAYSYGGYIQYAM